MTSTARAGRRRRMLHEGSGAAGSVAPQSDPAAPSSRVRYTPRDGSASFAVASSVLPRSPLALAGVVTALVAVAAALVWADRFSAGVATANANAARLLTFAQPGSLAAWYEAGLWLAVSIQSLLLFGVRRQRTDDTRGAYRWWIVVALAALGMSLNSATHAHAAVAAQAAASTGFSPLAGDAFWWLAPGTLVLGGIVVRSLMEIKESPVAAATGVAGVVIGLAGWLAAAGLTPGLVTSLAPALGSPLFAPAAVLAAVSLASLTLLLYSRRIVREAAGEVEAPVAAPKTNEAATEPERPKAKTKAEPKPAKPKRPVLHTPDPEEEIAEPEIVPSRAAKRANRRAAEEATDDSDRWVSGAEGYDDDYDEGPARRKLSKAERKRLRREKARRAA